MLFIYSFFMLVFWGAADCCCFADRTRENRVFLRGKPTTQWPGWGEGNNCQALDRQLLLHTNTHTHTHIGAPNSGLEPRHGTTVVRVF